MQLFFLQLHHPSSSNVQRKTTGDQGVLQGLANFVHMSAPTIVCLVGTEPWRPTTNVRSHCCTWTTGGVVYRACTMCGNCTCADKKQSLKCKQQAYG